MENKKPRKPRKRPEDLKNKRVIFCVTKKTYHLILKTADERDWDISQVMTEAVKGYCK